MSTRSKSSSAPLPLHQSDDEESVRSGRASSPIRPPVLPISPLPAPSDGLDFAKLAQVLNIKAPFLSEDMTKTSIKTFINAYQRYKRQCLSLNLPAIPIQRCLLPDRSNIATIFGSLDGSLN